MKMIQKLTLAALGFALSATARSVVAAEISATPPAGYYKLTALGASDTLLALPLVRRTAWMGRVTAVTADRLTLATADPVATGAATPTAANWYYAEFVTGPLAGLAYPVAANTAGTFTLETHGDDLTAHALGVVAAGEAGDIVRIRSGWSVTAVFGATDSPVLNPSPIFTGEVYLSGDAVLIPDNDTLGTEKKPAAVLAYVDGQGWRQRGLGDADAGGWALPPWTPFTVRRGLSSSLEITVFGYLPSASRVLRLPALPAGADADFAITRGSAEPVAVGGSQLAAVLAASSDAANPTDLMLDYSGFRRGFDRPPEHILALIGGHWIEADVNRDDFILSPATGYILRLRGERPVRYWRQNSPE